MIFLNYFFEYFFDYLFHYLSGFEQKNGYLPQVKVNEMLGFVGNVRPKVPTSNAMPSWVVLLVELFLDVRGNVLFDIVFLDCLGGNVDGVLLHILGHVSVFNDSFSGVRHVFSGFFAILQYFPFGLVFLGLVYDVNE